MDTVKKEYPIPGIDRVLVRQDTALDKTQGGIIIPDSHKEKPNKGVILSVGPLGPGAVKFSENDQRILFNKYAGTTITFDNEDLVILRQADVLLVY